jgi:hypothetical protein
MRELVRGRPVVISSAIGTRGHWYFFAEIEPWMPDPEPSMTVLNDRMRARYLAELARRGIPCLVAMRPEDAEVRMARAGTAPREEWLLPTREGTFLVSCPLETGGTAGPQSSPSRSSRRPASTTRSEAASDATAGTRAAPRVRRSSSMPA